MYLNIVSIENDYQAEEIIRQIKEEQAEKDRLIGVCNYEIERYKQMIEGYEQVYNNSTKDALSLLGEYCRNNPVKTTDTTIQRKLPSGKLQWKRHEPKITRDNATLLEWLKLNCKDGYIKSKEEPDWESFKKTLSVNGEHMVTEDGEIVGGVVLEEQPDTFEIK